MHIVYILISVIRQNWSYVGSTSNIKQRFKEHQFGKVKSTKAFRPLMLVYTEQYTSREEAYKRELYLKSGMGREEKNNIIKNKK